MKMNKRTLIMRHFTTKLIKHLKEMTFIDAFNETKENLNKIYKDNLS